MKGVSAPAASAATRRAPSRKPSPKAGSDASALPAGQRYTAWTFGELPELMEIRKGGTSLIGFPALIDQGDAVTIEVFDEPDVAAAKHRAGLRRLFALQIKDALKYLEKNIPDLQKMAVAYMPLGTLEELREQIIEVALERAFMLDPLARRRSRLQAPDRGRPRPPDPDRQRSGAPGRHRSWSSTRPRCARSRTRRTSPKPRPTPHSSCSA